MTLVKFRNGNAISNFPNFEGSFTFPSFFSDAFDRISSDESISWIPAVNIKERAEDFKIDLAAPGMDKKDFKIEVDNKVLVISGERKEEMVETNENISRREFHYGTFRRVFNLPDSANTENISANYKDGVLSLIVAKRIESTQKGKKQINVD